MRKTMFERLAMRTMLFAVLCVAAFYLMQPLTIASGYPEVMRGMVAAAVVAWAELTQLWVRLAAAPRVDEQKATEDVHELADPRALAMLYAVHAFKWSVRVVLFAVVYLVQ